MCSSTSVDLDLGLTLKAFQAFAEIDQPKIPYIFRMQHSRAGTIEMSIHPCDGAAWRLPAEERVRAYLREHLQSIEHLKGRYAVI